MGVRLPLYDLGPEDLRAAKQELRDRLFAPLVESVAEVLAARRAKRFHPNPAIHVVGIGLGEKVTLRA